MSRLTVRVAPRASRNAIEGWDAQGRLQVRLTAPPVEGEANAALIELLSRALGVARTRMRLIRGERSRTKTLEIEGLEEAELRAVLAGVSTKPRHA